MWTLYAAIEATTSTANEVTAVHFTPARLTVSLLMNDTCLIQENSPSANIFAHHINQPVINLKIAKCSMSVCKLQAQRCQKSLDLSSKVFRLDVNSDVERRSTDYGATYQKLNDKVGAKTILSYLYVSPNNKRKQIPSTHACEGVQQRPAGSAVAWRHVTAAGGRQKPLSSPSSGNKSSLSGDGGTKRLEDRAQKDRSERDRDESGTETANKLTESK
ncbi:hypothetical protein PAMA_015826 [Pampus argenteus]